MATKKMSYSVAVENAINGNITDEVRERLEALKERVFSAMTAGEGYGSKDIATLIPELEGASSQKITALMKSLGERVTAEKVKGKAVYKIA